MFAFILKLEYLPYFDNYILMDCDIPHPFNLIQNTCKFNWSSLLLQNADIDPMLF